MVETANLLLKKNVAIKCKGTNEKSTGYVIKKKNYGNDEWEKKVKGVKEFKKKKKYCLNDWKKVRMSPKNVFVIGYIYKYREKKSTYIF